MPHAVRMVTDDGGGEQVRPGEKPGARRVHHDGLADPAARRRPVGRRTGEPARAPGRRGAERLERRPVPRAGERDLGRRDGPRRRAGGRAAAHAALARPVCRDVDRARPRRPRGAHRHGRRTHRAAALRGGARAPPHDAGPRAAPPRRQRAARRRVAAPPGRGPHRVRRRGRGGEPADRDVSPRAPARPARHAHGHAHGYGHGHGCGYSGCGYGCDCSGCGYGYRCRYLERRRGRGGAATQRVVRDGGGAVAGRRALGGRPRGAGRPRAPLRRAHAGPLHALRDPPVAGAGHVRDGRPVPAAQPDAAHLVPERHGQAGHVGLRHQLPAAHGHDRQRALLPAAAARDDAVHALLAPRVHVRRAERDRRGRVLQRLQPGTPPSSPPLPPRRRGRCSPCVSRGPPGCPPTGGPSVCVYMWRVCGVRVACGWRVGWMDAGYVRACVRRGCRTTASS